MNPHAARGRLAASLRLLAAPLLDAQRRAWESGDHPGILFAGAVISSLINAVAGRAHLDGGDGRPSVVMNDGEQLAIFRRMHLDAPGQPAPISGLCALAGPPASALSRQVCAHGSSGFDRVTVPGIVLVRLGSGGPGPGLWVSGW